MTPVTGRLCVMLSIMFHDYGCWTSFTGWDSYTSLLLIITAVSARLCVMLFMKLHDYDDCTSCVGCDGCDDYPPGDELVDKLFCGVTMRWNPAIGCGRLWMWIVKFAQQL